MLHPIDGRPLRLASHARSLQPPPGIDAMRRLFVGAGTSTLHRRDDDPRSDVQPAAAAEFRRDLRQHELHPRRRAGLPVATHRQPAGGDDPAPFGPEGIASTVPLGALTMPRPQLRDKGVFVMTGTDSVIDHWSPFGSGDMLERSCFHVQVYRNSDEFRLSRSLAIATGRVLPLDDEGRRACRPAAPPSIRGAWSAAASARPESVRNCGERLEADAPDDRAHPAIEGQPLSLALHWLQ